MRYGMWLYPWDLFDHGPQRVVGELHDMGVDDVFLALSYHSVRVLLPDNPKRRFFDAPTAALYVDADPAPWSELGVEASVSPLVAEHGDAARAARTALADAPLRLVAWTVCLHDSSLARRWPAAAGVDPWGYRSQSSLCLSNAWTRAYARTLVRAASTHADAVQLEAAHWLAPHAVHAKLDAGQPNLFARLTSLCVCNSCGDLLAAEGVDVVRLRDQLGRVAAIAVDEPVTAVVPAEYVDGYLDDTVTDFPALRRCRAQAVTSLVAELVQAVPGKPVEFLSYGDRRMTGADLSAIERVGAAIRLLAYGPPVVVQRAFDELNASIDVPATCGVGLSALPTDAPDQRTLRAAHDVAIGAGATSVAYYNYGMLTATRRGWLRDVMARSG